MNHNKGILNRFLTEKIAINVETQQEWEDFMELLEEETDLKWEGGDNPTEYEDWSSHTELSAIVSNFYGNRSLTYSSIDFYQEESYEIIKYKDLIKGEETMTNIEKVNKALAGADEDKIKEVLDFLGHKEDSKFIPKHSERCYYISGGGVYPTYYDNYSPHDEYKLLMNNVYRTREEAEQALDFQIRKAKLIKEIEDSSEPMDWSKDNQYKHCFWLDGLDDTLRLKTDIFVQTQGTNYTTNIVFLEELIKERPDEVKELLFNIKEDVS